MTSTCAISATGHGEIFIRYAAAHDIAARMRYAGQSLEEAARARCDRGACAGGWIRRPDCGGSERGVLAAIQLFGNVSRGGPRATGSCARRSTTNRWSISDPCPDLNRPSAVTSRRGNPGRSARWRQSAFLPDRRNSCRAWAFRPRAKHVDVGFPPIAIIGRHADAGSRLDGVRSARLSLTMKRSGRGSFGLRPSVVRRWRLRMNAG